MARVNARVLMLAAGVAGAAAGVLAPGALGQTALGDGQVLDRNLSTQGRTNTRVKNIEQQIRFNNDVLEGRAGRGRSFQGDLGYRSTDNFAGSLGSDSLYNFRRDSTSGDFAALPGVRTSDALRYQFALTGAGGGRSTGLSESARALFTERSLGQVASGSNSPTSTGPLGTSAVSSLRSVSQYTSDAAQAATVLGYAGTDQTGRFALTASPLRGIAPTPLGGAEAAAGFGFAPAGLSGLERTATGILRPGESDIAPRGAREEVPPRRSIAQRIEPSGTAMEEVRESLVKAIDLKMSRRFGVEKPGEKPADDPNQKPADKAAPGDQSPDPEGAARGEVMRGIDALAARLRGEKPADRTAKPGDGVLQPEPPKPEPGARTNEDPPPDETVFQTLRRMESRISTFKARPEQAGDAYARRMADAEAQMKAGEYFNAEGTFSLALLGKPRDPIALVGRTHAQIGAGLLLSAAAGLREAFASAPELIGTRFEPGMLPTFARAEAAIATIKAELAKPESALGADGALLMAYLGRHFDQPAWLSEGLAGLARRTPADDTKAAELLNALRKVWSPEAEPPAPSTPPTPPAPPASPASPSGAPVGDGK